MCFNPFVLSPWSDDYDTVTDNTTTEHVQKLLSVHLPQLKSEAVVYSAQEHASGEGEEKTSILSFPSPWTDPSLLICCRQVR